MDCRILADTMIQIVEKIFDATAKGVKVALPRSTMLHCMPDPTGLLRPGQVHLNFSQPLKAEDRIYTVLHGFSGLVARLPALGAADIQRVNFVFKPELAHLTDVVIFPVRGPRPLASKLQVRSSDAKEKHCLADCDRAATTMETRCGCAGSPH